MSGIDLEQVRAAMFADPGVKAVEGLRLLRTANGEHAISANVTVAASSVDLDLVRAVIAAVLADQFAIDQVELTFDDPGPVSAQPTSGLMEKK